jgi:hypothetical protein
MLDMILQRKREKSEHGKIVGSETGVPWNMRPELFLELEGCLQHQGYS